MSSLRFSLNHFSVSKFSIAKMSSSARVAILQLNCTSDKLQNRQKSQELLTKAKDFGVQAAFLPECFDFVGENAKQTSEMAEFVDQENGIVEFYRNLAKDLNMVLSLGGFHEKIIGSDKLANTHLLIDQAGEIIGKYRFKNFPFHKVFLCFHD